MTLEKTSNRSKKVQVEAARRLLCVGAPTKNWAGPADAQPTTPPDLLAKCAKYNQFFHPRCKSTSLRVRFGAEQLLGRSAGTK